MDFRPENTETEFSSTQCSHYESESQHTSRLQSLNAPAHELSTEMRGIHKNTNWDFSESAKGMCTRFDYEASRLSDVVFISGQQDCDAELWTLYLACWRVPFLGSASSLSCVSLPAPNRESYEQSRIWLYYAVTTHTSKARKLPRNKSSLANISLWSWAWWHTNVKREMITHISAYVHKTREIYKGFEISNN